MKEAFRELKSGKESPTISDHCQQSTYGNLGSYPCHEQEPIGLEQIWGHGIHGSLFMTSI